ncbi:uncharacterized protein LOC111625136 [Centruroides sculpturatus]|uniref:uncharacterized protein LOC111625136 n=1 Tax=Centruroides sculpturatus TaxID=218467 RepID=UPI000C6E41CB|nr:uncharacterized protein LOC111625136 [Centruroides sculpturatus]XP_023223946.1 uncharacterized protein LOC111625136 [Centruroides sculpturatus]
MLLQRFVKFIPFLSDNHNKSNEFIISEAYFTWCTCELDRFKNNIITIKNEDIDSILIENNNDCTVEFHISKFIEEIKDDKCHIFSKTDVKTKDLQIENIIRKLYICPDCINKIKRKCHLCIENTESFCGICTIKEYIHFKLKMDIQLFSYLVIELERSPAFRAAVVNNLYHFYSEKHPSNQLFQKICDICQNTIEIVTVSVLISWPKYCLMDKLWNKRISLLVNERCEVENAMSWLSTLGGAYSSLGDYFLYCAKQAENISLQQFKLALKLGDPLTIARCKIYFAMSLVQQGYYTEAKRIIRTQYSFSLTKMGRLDFRLSNMCKAIWNKLKYLESGDSLSTHAQKT